MSADMFYSHDRAKYKDMGGVQCILFINIDGVMHPKSCHTEDLFCQRQLIEDLLREHKDVEVVVSGQWADYFSLEKLKEFFSPDIQHRIVDILKSNDKHFHKSAPRNTSEFARGVACKKWIKENRSTYVPWVALDSDSHLFSPDCANLFATNAMHGVDQSDIIELYKMLKIRAIIMLYETPTDAIIHRPKAAIRTLGAH